MRWPSSSVPSTRPPIAPPFRTRWLNVALGRFIGVLIFRPYDNYRVFHWAHHRFTQDPERDPELYFPKPRSLGAYVLTLTGLPYLRRRFADMLVLARGRADKPWMPAHERRRLIIEARAHLAIYLGVAAGSVALASPAILLVWFLPFLVGQAFLQPYLLAEHTGLRPHPRQPHQHAHHAHLAPGPALRLEHALPRGASRLPRRALPRAAPAPRARARSAGQRRTRLCRRQHQGESPPLRLQEL